MFPVVWGSVFFLLKRRMRRIASGYGISVSHLPLVHGKTAYHNQVRISILSIRAEILYTAQLSKTFAHANTKKGKCKVQDVLDLMSTTLY